MLPTINAPLSPLISTVKLAYQASDCWLDDSTTAAPANAQARCFYLTPFGHCASRSDLQSFLASTADYQGHLYLGLRSTQQPESLSLYFEFREKSATQYVLPNGADELPQEEVTWRYLANDVWCELPAQTVVSHTDGFSRSGMVSSTMPADISAQNSSMPAGLYWLETRVRDHAANMCTTVKILPQAVQVQRCTPVHHAGVPIILPAASINALVKKTPKIKSISQPFATVNGRAAETVQDFRSRVSQRLQHKQRAVRPADYERLVLELFAAVWQVKCSNVNNSFGYPVPLDIMPGDIVVTVVAPVDTSGSLPIVPLPLYQLKQIAQALRACSSPFVRRLVVRNPQIERLKVFVTVHFQTGMDSGDSIQLLNEAISDFIAPWRRDPEQAMALGCGAVYAYQIAEMIRRLSYVKEIGPLSILRTFSDGGGDMTWIDESGSIAPTTPWSALVPVSEHGIVAGTQVALEQEGVGAMKIGSSFHVATVNEAWQDAAPLPSADAHYFLLIGSTPPQQHDGERE